MAPFGAPIGHISVMGAEGVVDLWADAKELAKASKHVYLDANDSRSSQHALSLASSADPTCFLLLGAKVTYVGSESSKLSTPRGAGLRL